MFAPSISTWKKAPFIRFLLPLIAGILLQWHLQLPVQTGWYVLCFSGVVSLTLFSLSWFNRYRLTAINGIVITLVFLALGSLLAWHKDIRHDPAWFGRFVKTGKVVIVTIREELVEKNNSYKAIATVNAIDCNEKFISTCGELILYFQKDTITQILENGSQIIFSKPLQEIKNSGNPGGFDYKQYSLFHDITHQVYLKPGDFIVLKEKKSPGLENLLISIRKKILRILRSYIRGEKEKGLAEALLIGYKNDLDKDLVQSYSNTGVVHIIAISGLHLGLIYGLLIQLLKPFKKRKGFKWLSPVLIIAGLWLFSLLAGAQPSVLRSALMFTSIVLAETVSRKTSIYNSLAFSAFILLCINPFWLWDVGFQLSYAAVLSIVIFMKPVYNWLYIKNKVLDFAWKLNAISIAAQLLTTPLSIYHFHQFPNFFLLTNFVAVPLSSIIVLGEIFLCTISFLPWLAGIAGKILSWFIWLMNSYIERIESLPGSLWGGMQITISQAVLLIVLISGLGYWTLEKQKAGAWVGIVSLLLFTLLRSVSFLRSQQQQELVIYNVPKHQAIDIMNGRNCLFLGDTDLLKDDFVRRFHLKPARVLHRVEPVDQLKGLFIKNEFLHYGARRILLIDRNIHFAPTSKKIVIDLLIASKNPKLYFPQLLETFIIKGVVFDSSVPARKLKTWATDCDSLHIPYYNVNETGAFVMRLN